MKITFFTALAALVFMTSCSSTQGVTSVSNIAGEWTIEQINGSAIDKKAGDSVPFLGFDVKDKRVYGNTGCNSLTGILKIDANNIDFGNMGCTRMMCANMGNEQKVLNALNQVKKFNLNAHGNLVLTNNNGKEIILLVKKK